MGVILERSLAGVVCGGHRWLPVCFVLLGWICPEEQRPLMESKIKLPNNIV